MIIAFCCVVCRYEDTIPMQLAPLFITILEALMTDPPSDDNLKVCINAHIHSFMRIHTTHIYLHTIYCTHTSQWLKLPHTQMQTHTQMQIHTPYRSHSS